MLSFLVHVKLFYRIVVIVMFSPNLLKLNYTICMKSMCVFSSFISASIYYSPAVY